MNPWPIAPLSQQDLDFAAVNYDFASFTDNEQTDLPSLEGFIDNSLLDYAGSIADQTSLIASLFDGMDDVFTVLGEIGNDDFESLLGDLSNAATAGDASLVTYASLVGTNAGSGGGGGGVSIGGACGSIDFGSIQTSLASGANSVSADWVVSNPTSSDVHVKGATSNPPLGGVFMAFPSPAGTTIPAGGSLTVTILFTPQSPGTYSSTMTLLTDAPDPQPCVNLTGTGVGPSLLGGPIGGSPAPPTPPAPSGGGPPPVSPPTPRPA